MISRNGCILAYEAGGMIDLERLASVFFPAFSLGLLNEARGGV